jgi:hypothetical protein
MQELVFEVFARKNRGEALRHIGYLSARMPRTGPGLRLEDLRRGELVRDVHVSPGSAIIPVNRTDGPFAGGHRSGVPPAARLVVAETTGGAARPRMNGWRAEGLPKGPSPTIPSVQAFRRLLLGMADSKRILGIRYSDWLLGAPSIEAGIAASSMAQDEWGHARLLYATLKDFGADPEAVEHDRGDENAYASWDPLDEPLPDWAWVTAAMMVVDGALATALEGILENGAYEPLQGRMQKMLGEEEFHEALAEAWFTRLATSQGRDESS